MNQLNEQRNSVKKLSTLETCVKYIEYNNIYRVILNILLMDPENNGPLSRQLKCSCP